MSLGDRTLSLLSRRDLVPETRFIQSKSRRPGDPGARTRIVEVVHVRRRGQKVSEPHPSTEPQAVAEPTPPPNADLWAAMAFAREYIQAEAKSQQTPLDVPQEQEALALAEPPKAAEPVAHFIDPFPSWLPTPLKVSGAVAPAGPPQHDHSEPEEPPKNRRRKKEEKVARVASKTTRKKPGAKAKARRYLDPFSDEDGANCLRCGYIVEAAREKKGLLTCRECSQTSSGRAPSRDDPNRRTARGTCIR